MRLAKLSTILLGSLALAAPAHAAPTITEFGGLSSPGSGITAGPDGAVWIAEPANPGRIARMTTSGAVTEYTGNVATGFSNDRKPTAMTTSADGSLWFTEVSGSGKVARITTSGVVSEFPLSTGAPAGIAADASGNVWVTLQGGSGAIARVTPAGTITYFTAGLSAGSLPAGITRGADGAMWFTESATPGRVGRIAADGTITERSAGLSASLTPLGIASSADGRIWLTESGGVGGVVSLDLGPVLDPLLGGTLSELLGGLLGGPTAGTAPSAIAAGPDGAMWFTAAGRIGRIAADGTVTEHPGMTTTGVPAAIAAGPDGAMWFTQPGEDLVGRISVPPLATTATAATVADTTATVSAGVRPNGTPTTYHLEVSDAGGLVISTAEVSAGNGAGLVPLSFALNGLSASTAYTARIVATSLAGVSVGAAVSFTTAATVTVPAPAPTATPQADGAPQPEVRDEAVPGEDPAPPAVPAATVRPVLGHTVALRPDRGTVLVKVPGRADYAPLDGTSTLPVGAVVDARNGSVRLDSALTSGRVQAGHFRGGLFRVRQSGRAGGVTDLVLAGAIDCRKRRATTAVASARTRKPRSRRLWGKDRGGLFRTHGRDSVATVRGTSWLTQDSCAGTLVRVKSGAVSVRDRGSRRAVLVKAGGRHLAPRR